MDGDQLVDFYCIDPVMFGERLAGKSIYAGNLYLQFEKEDSWTRAVVRAFGRINGELKFEAAYVLDKTSVPLISVFCSDKSFLSGMSHHPIYRKHILMFCAYLTYFTYPVLFAIFRNSFQHKGGFPCNAHQLVSCGLDVNYRRVY